MFIMMAAVVTIMDMITIIIDGFWITRAVFLEPAQTCDKRRDPDQVQEQGC